MNTVGINSITLWKMALGIRDEACKKAIQEYTSYVAEIRNKIMNDLFTKAYINCALSLSTDDDNKPLSEKFDHDSIAIETLFTMVQDCYNFRVSNAADMKDLDVGQCGHDFWIARQGQQGGFCERNLGEVGDRLTKAAAKFGGVRLYEGADGQLCQ
jgi:hypothetical protein